MNAYTDILDLENDYRNTIKRLRQDINKLEQLSNNLNDKDTIIVIKNQISTLKNFMIILIDDLEDIIDGKAPRSLLI